MGKAKEKKNRNCISCGNSLSNRMYSCANAFLGHRFSM